MVLIGTKKTDNNLNTTLGKGQYENVTEFRALEKVNIDSLRSVDDIKLENAPS